MTNAVFVRNTNQPEVVVLRAHRNDEIVLVCEYLFMMAAFQAFISFVFLLIAVLREDDLADALLMRLYIRFTIGGVVWGVFAYALFIL